MVGTQGALQLSVGACERPTAALVPGLNGRWLLTMARSNLSLAKRLQRFRSLFGAADRGASVSGSVLPLPCPPL